MHYVLSDSAKENMFKKYPNVGLSSTLLVNLSLRRKGLNDYSIECALEMAVHIHRIHEINDGLKGIGARNLIDTEIYHRMMEYILDPSKPLSRVERKRLFMEQQKISNLSYSMSCLDLDHLPLANEIEIMAFGIHSQERELLNNEGLWNELGDYYSSCHDLLTNGNVEYERFDETFETFVESARIGYKKERERKENRCDDF